ncbi:MAG: hypothetical protein ACOX7I_08485 [Oscillospiraceae bacterium]
MNKPYHFENLIQIEAFEMLKPGIFATDPEANLAARQCLEQRLEHWHKMLDRMFRAAEGSIAYCHHEDCLNKIKAINRWMREHPMPKKYKCRVRRKTRKY